MAANPGNNYGFQFAESAALKHRILELQLSDKRSNARPVQVFFGYPEGETEKKYPFMTIDLIGISYAPDRQESERQYIYDALNPTRSNKHYFIDTSDEADLATLAGNDGILTEDQVVPVDMIFQVTTHSRDRIHDIQMTNLLFWRVFPMRRGFIMVPEDGTIRRCDLLDYRPLNVLDQEAGYNKAVLRKAFTVSINSEIPQSDLIGAQRVLEVRGTLIDNNSANDALSPTFSEEF